MNPGPENPDPHRPLNPPDQEAVYALVLVADQQLGKHDAPLRVHGAVGDPVLVAQGAGAVDNEAADARIPRGRGRHLDRVVACSRGPQQGWQRWVLVASRSGGARP